MMIRAKDAAAAGKAMFAALALSAAAFAGTASAQPAAPAAVEPDAATLVEARKLIEMIMPPESRDAMIATMMQAAMGNATKGLLENPEFQKKIETFPGASAAFERYPARQIERTTKLLTDNLPGLLDAMARAYARRFTIVQLREIEAFFATPTGKHYLMTAPGIMADPDIAAWQIALMQRSLPWMTEEMEKIQAEIKALGTEEKKGKAHD